MYNDEHMEERIMATQYTEEFKRDSVRYWKEHPELGIGRCAKNLGISKSALSTWGKAYDENEGSVPTRGRGNYGSDDAKDFHFSCKQVLNPAHLQVFKISLHLQCRYPKTNCCHK